jgi:DtxR family Mn-dependent transcriptional regulator
MASQGLVMIQGGTLTLTPEGERLAIHITRAHRLLERYLADEARMPLKQIHKEAHHREHQISADEVDELDAFLGHPARDPHGDPIPDHSGSFREKVMKPLTLLGPGELGRVAHIEDEPVIAYAQIQAEGIFLGQTLRLVESTPERLVLTDGEGEFRLAPAIATNVHLEEVAQLSPQHELIPLHQLDGRQEAEIVKLDEACQGFTRRRFLDLGLTPGAAIYPELPNAFGDPRAYRIRGTLVALRKEQAEQIWVKPIDSTQKADALQKEMEN